MATPFIGEIRVLSFAFAPKGWAQCNGQLMLISQNQALFSLIGTTYGGDGRTYFALPNLQGRVPLHRSNSYPPGQSGGEQTHTLAVSEAPVHTHSAMGTTTAGNSPIPTANLLGAASNAYGPLASTSTLQPATVTTAGGGQAHDNVQPYLTVNFCIALQGIFPSRP